MTQWLMHQDWVCHEDINNKYWLQLCLMPIKYWNETQQRLIADLCSRVNIKCCNLFHLAFCKLTGIRIHGRLTGRHTSRQNRRLDLELVVRGGWVMHLLSCYFTSRFALLCFYHVFLSPFLALLFLHCSLFVLECFPLGIAWLSAYVSVTSTYNHVEMEASTHFIIIIL